MGGEFEIIFNLGENLLVKGEKEKIFKKYAIGSEMGFFRPSGFVDWQKVKEVKSL